MIIETKIFIDNHYFIYNHKEDKIYLKKRGNILIPLNELNNLPNGLINKINLFVGSFLKD